MGTAVSEIKLVLTATDREHSRPKVCSRKAVADAVVGHN